MFILKFLFCGVLVAIPFVLGYEEGYFQAKKEFVIRKTELNRLVISIIDRLEKERIIESEEAERMRQQIKEL